MLRLWSLIETKQRFLMKLGQHLNLTRSNCKLPIVKRHVVDPQWIKTGEGRYMPRQASFDTQTSIPQSEMGPHYTDPIGRCHPR